jgi:hypothetical protein
MNAQSMPTSYDHATAGRLKPIEIAETLPELPVVAVPRTGLVARALRSAGRALVAVGEQVAAAATLGSRI